MDEARTTTQPCGLATCDRADFADARDLLDEVLSRANCLFREFEPEMERLEAGHSVSKGRLGGGG